MILVLFTMSTRVRREPCFSRRCYFGPSSCRCIVILRPMTSWSEYETDSFERIQSSPSPLKVECLLTLAIWSYGHEAEEYIFFWTYRFLQTPRKILQFAVFQSTPEQNLLLRIIGCTPNTFHNTINKNVNHSNDTIDNLNQSSFHKPACQCQGHLRTESFPASAHILHCGVKYGLGWCGPASALKIVRQLIFDIIDNHVTFV